MTGGVGTKYGIEIPKLGALKRVLGSDDLLAEPWRKMMGAIGKIGELVAVARGPIGPTGSTVARLTHRVQAKPIPLYVAIKTTAKNPRNKYPYPRRIEFDPASRRRGWFRAALVFGARPLFPPILESMASQIFARVRSALN